MSASTHPTHVSALCSERLSWMTANDDVHHSEPYQLLRNRKCEYLCNILEIVYQPCSLLCFSFFPQFIVEPANFPGKIKLYILLFPLLF